MINLKIPENLSYIIRNYVIRTFNTRSQYAEMKEFLETISPSLHKEICDHIFS